MAQKSLRDYVDAEQHLDAALQNASDPWITKNREALELARKVIKGELGWVLVTAAPAGAELSVNGALIGTLPLDKPHRVVAGRTVIEIRAEGHVDHRSEHQVPAAAVVEHHVELEKKEEPPKALPPPDPAPDPVPPTAPEERAEPVTYVPWIIGTGALSAVALGVGIGLGVRTLDLKEERDAICPDPDCPTQEGVDLDEEARDFAIGSTVSFVTAGVAAVAVIVLWIIEPSEDVDVAASTLRFRF